MSLHQHLRAFKGHKLDPTILCRASPFSLYVEQAVLVTAFTGLRGMLSAFAKLRDANRICRNSTTLHNPEGCKGSSG